MKKALKLSLLLLVVLSLSSCDWPWEDDDDDVDASAGSAAVQTGGTNVGTQQPAAKTTAATTSTTTAKTTTTQTTASKGVTEYGRYVGRTNPNRPTWYFSKTMSRYPSTFTFSSGCGTFTVRNNGHRWEGGGHIVKQSDVPGRGMAALAPGSCGSNKAYVKF